ncbi:putative DNA modification/repair radical SAM protein [Exilibacterium tricleocarpae]|uniref:Putative DNA modification/repair radical SAM protein n=1 Tax=Exilibacterium tricleocarpae TaxID=2591008 RepID=A0A545SYV6_9GAMM|nr:putative DNA modification/repair radical SAM protein [Exilibacterium tricleocarpae]TQV70119.1 putative DNA modification/repair radical SAM protein [Exilibacterium tricleocarpae]
MNRLRKLTILADAAKYDASCASSGSVKRDSSGGRGVGSTTGMGICHSYAPDGRCISLLKLLLTNFCIYECSYCINRASSNVQRARFSVEEVVDLTLDFYKRNYIEGLFLSSGIIRSADYTMEQLVRVARCLRETHDFRGYIHLKTIPDASPALIEQAGLYADRLSINIELPSVHSLARFAPEKSLLTIRKSMGQVREHIDEAKESRHRRRRRRAAASTFHYSPAGQSTQMIVGADDSTDSDILSLSHNLYRTYDMRRVYYSAFSPIPDAAQTLPARPPPLLREHRLYQADWLLRFYGFGIGEIVETDRSGTGMLDLDVDPKLAWALRHRDLFPVNVNRAPLETLLRVPGIGAIGAGRIVQARQFSSLRFKDLAKCGLSTGKIAPFVETADHHPSLTVLEDQDLKQRFMRGASPQLTLFS